MTENIPDRIWRPGPLAEKLGVSRMTLNRWYQQDPTFPRKIQLGRRAVGFRESEIEAWLDSRQTGGATQ